MPRPRLLLALLTGTLLAACGTEIPTLTTPDAEAAIRELLNRELPVREVLEDGTVVFRSPVAGSGG
jgi:hypothetical protein